MRDISALLDHVDLLVVNEVEAFMLRDQLELPHGAAFTELAARTNCQVVMTRGGAGAVASTPAGDAIEVAGEAVEVVDTTGAGDTFVGALVAGLAISDTLEQAVRRANRAGALACTALGAQAAMPYRNDLDRDAPFKPSAPPFVETHKRRTARC
jgi:ribokinase